MTATLFTPRAVFRDARLTDTDRRVLITALEEGMLDLVESREIKLAALASLIRRRADGAKISRATICRSLQRLVRTEYLAVEVGATARSPRRYRVRLSVLGRAE